MIIVEFMVVRMCGFSFSFCRSITVISALHGQKKNSLKHWALNFEHHFVSTGAFTRDILASLRVEVQEPVEVLSGLVILLVAMDDDDDVLKQNNCDAGYKREKKTCIRTIIGYVEKKKHFAWDCHVWKLFQNCSTFYANITLELWCPTLSPPHLVSNTSLIRLKFTAAVKTLILSHILHTACVSLQVIIYSAFVYWLSSGFTNVSVNEI